MGEVQQKVRVELGKDSYEIIIGRNLQGELQEFVKGAGFSKKALLLTDSKVGKIYGEKVCSWLKAAGLEAALVTVPAGESSKSLAVAESVYTECIKAGLDRKSPVFALGGGVVGDLSGFIAATYMRGVPFVQLPTSLLAQVDSSVGGKVAVNHALGKNLIGAFYQPKAVFMDLEMMETLPPREISTGLGEVVKYGLIYDADFFSYLESQVGAILALEHESLSHLIARCCEIKAAVVSEDEKEAGLRRILNFGHTIGHAIEKETGYARYNHGEAVAIGMVGAVRLSISQGLLPEEVLPRTEKLLQALNLPIRAEGCTVDKMYEDIFHDKKTVGGKVTWVLITEIGKTACKSDISEKAVREAMEYCLMDG